MELLKLGCKWLIKERPVSLLDRWAARLVFRLYHLFTLHRLGMMVVLLITSPFLRRGRPSEYHHLAGTVRSVREMNRTSLLNWTGGKCTFMLTEKTWTGEDTFSTHPGNDTCLNYLQMAMVMPYSLSRRIAWLDAIWCVMVPADWSSFQMNVDKQN